MPSPEQMENDVREILEYCGGYRGIHEDVFTTLRERLSEIDQLTDESGGQRRERIDSMYRDAISTLLLLADPPGHGTYEQVLNAIGAIADTPITGVRFYPEAPVESVVARWGPYDLLGNLPERRPLAAEQRELLAFFRSQLSAAEANDPRFGGEEDA